MSGAAVLAWRIAAHEAYAAGCAAISGAHLLIGLCKLVHLRDPEGAYNSLEEKAAFAQIAEEVSELADVFAMVRLDPVRARRLIRSTVGRQGPVHGHRVMHRDDLCREAFARADAMRDVLGSEAARPIHLLWALAECGEPVIQAVLKDQNISPHAVRKAVQLHITGLVPQPSQEAQPQLHRTSTPVLDQAGRDLTRLAREHRLAPMVGRSDEVKQLAQALLRIECGNAMLIGEAGVGKTRIVEGLAQMIATGRIVHALSSRRIVEVSLSNLVAGACYRGDFEQRFQALLAEAACPEIILFFDEAHLLIGSGGGMDAANLLKPALARGEVRCIAATTHDEYTRFIGSDRALQRRFVVVYVEPPSPADAVKMLEGLRPRMQTHYGLTIAPEAVSEAVALSVRYNPNEHLPHKAVELMESASSQAVLEQLTGDGAAPEITATDIRKAAAALYRVPVDALGTDEVVRLRRLEDDLRQRIIGQDEAVQEVSAAVRRARLGARGQGPRSVLMFAGPTGTGKTELAKALAAALFGSDEQLIRLDMAEYVDPASVNKLLGAPPAYIGHEDEPLLLKSVRVNPHSLVLLDEFDKAHKDVHRVFLSILSDGRLTDARGRTVSFKETMVVMTTNLGGAAGYPMRRVGLREPDGDGACSASRRKSVLAAVHSAFSAEFVNRIDSIVIFDPLSDDVLHRIVHNAARKLAEDVSVRLTLDDSVPPWLVAQGDCRRYGAREIERLVRRLIGGPLTDMQLNGDLVQCEAVHVSVVEDALNFAMHVGGARRLSPHGARREHR